MGSLVRTAEFCERERSTHQSTMQKLATLADSTKASLDAASVASARSENALRNANKRSRLTVDKLLASAADESKPEILVAQLEKGATETSEKIAQVVRDIQKLAYKKDDPG